MENILISACLLGICCRYDGQGKLHNNIEQLKEKYHLIPICPEQLGGLTTPRKPCEQSNGRVVTQDGDDYTNEFESGALEVLKLANLFDCKIAILKERSPSCGFGSVYDGSFSNRLISGDGITANLLKMNKIKIIGESHITSLF